MRHSMRRIAGNSWWALLVVALESAGCSSASRDEMTQVVLKSDPTFQAALAQRDAIEHQVDELRDRLIAKRTDTEQQIHILQQEFRETRSKLQGQIHGLIQQLTPERDKLQLEINTTQNNIRSQEAVVQGLKRTVAELQKSLNHPAPSTTTTITSPTTAPAAPIGAARSLPPTGQETAGMTTAVQDRAALEARLAEAQGQLQQALSALADQRAHRKLLQYKLRLLQIE